MTTKVLRYVMNKSGGYSVCGENHYLVDTEFVGK